MLIASGICKRFGPTVALRDVSAEFLPGQIHAVVGENGSGKSTLMRILAGEELPDSGELTLSGSKFLPKSPREALGKGVALIHQELAICAHLSVAENIFLGAEHGWRVSPRAQEARARAVLDELGFPEIDVRSRGGDLPISAQQIVEIARATQQEADVLLFDEPTSSLTQADIRKLFAVLARLKQAGKTVVYISHFLEEVREVADCVTILRDGERVHFGPMSGIDNGQIVRHMVGRDLTEMYPRSARTPGEVVLSVPQIGGQGKLVAASLELSRGEVVGIGGLNASGRTELLRAIFGLDRVKWRKIKVGRVSFHPTPANSWQQGVGLVSEDRKEEGLALNLSIEANLTLANLSGPWFSPTDALRRTSNQIEQMGVKCRSADQRIGELSGGNQQKVAIGRLLDSDCDVLLLDEPTRGIDVGSKSEIYALIDKLAQQGKAILIVSSYLPELLGICDRIAMMNRGRLSGTLPVAACTAEQLMEEATR